MSRVIGIDPGTVTLDLCGLDAGRVFFERALPTREALADPSGLVSILESHAPLDMVVGPSGYGLPLAAVRDLTETDLRLAFLSMEGDATSPIPGLLSLLRRLARTTLPVVVTPGVVHLTSVPAYRKANRVDMGTADKVCAVALGVHDQAKRRGCRVRDVSFIFLELGGAFTAAIAVQDGAIVDGLGGTSGPLGLRAAGALDGEVAFLAGTISKPFLFSGGAATIAGTPDGGTDQLAMPRTVQGRLAWDAYMEGVVKAVAALLVSAPGAFEIVLSGRLASVRGVEEQLADRVGGVIGERPVVVLRGFASQAGQAAQGAALIADGLAGGTSADLVESLGIREARGTVLDHLHVITPEAARARLGIN